jgi:hypothetical protein
LNFPLGSVVLTVIALAAVGLWVAVVILAWERVATSAHAVRKGAVGDHQSGGAAPHDAAATWLPTQRRPPCEAVGEPLRPTRTTTGDSAAF